MKKRRKMVDVDFRDYHPKSKSRKGSRRAVEKPIRTIRTRTKRDQRKREIKTGDKI